MEKWRKYETSFENLSSWVKVTEERVRQVTTTQVNLKTFEKEIANLKALQEDLLHHVDNLQELTVLSKKIIEECPESKVEQQVSTLNNRYKIMTKTLTKQMEKLLPS